MDYNDIYGLGIAVFIILLLGYYLLKRSEASSSSNHKSHGSPAKEATSPQGNHQPTQSSDQRNSHEDRSTTDQTPQRESPERTNEDTRSTAGKKDFSSTQALLDAFQQKLRVYRSELIPALEKNNKLFLEKIKRKLASDAGYFDEGENDFDTSAYSSLLSAINQEEFALLNLIEEFNKNPLWKGTEYEAIIKRALLHYEEAFAKRKSLTDAFNEAMKTMMS